jgi:transcriptional/translational regulatory protein YebC/TACO1
VWWGGFAAMIRARAAARRGCRPEAVYSVRFEGYGPRDCAVIVDCLTDDRDRTAAAVRGAFLSHGGHPGAAGSVAYLFKQVGRLVYPARARLDSHPGLAWEAGAEDVSVRRDGSVEVLTDPAELEAVRSSLAQASGEPIARGLTCRASVGVELSGEEAAELARLLRALESLEDVRSVYTNAETAGELLASV